MSQHDAPDQPQDEFDDAKADEFFEEFAADGPARPAPAEDPEGPESDPEGPESEPPRDDQGRFAAQDDDADGDDQGDDQGDDPGDEPGDEAPRETPEQELERLRQEAQSWQHRYQSDLGRQNALQRKIQALENENQRLQRQPAASGQGSDQEGAPEGSGYSDADWKALKEDFPEIASAMEQQLNAVTQRYEQRIGQLEQQLSPIQEQAQVQAQRAQEQALEAQHPDWRETINTPDFQSWLNAQPPKVQELTASSEAADAAFLLQSFKLSRGGEQPSRGPSDLQQRRQRQLQSARTVPNRGSRQRDTIPEDDEDALFDHFANKA